MAKKRKSDASRLDEVDRVMYSTFCTAANSLSQLYTHAMHQQKLSFQAGERHSLERLYNWILREQEGGVRVTAGDIFTYIQNELNYGTEEPPPSPRLPHQQQHQAQALMHIPHSGFPIASNAFGPAIGGQGLRSGNSDQARNSVFSNALSSPVRRTLHNYTPGGFSTNNVSRTSNSSAAANQIRDTNPPTSNDTSMDMHADSPGHDSPY